MKLFDPDILTDPYPQYQQWREHHPIWFDEETQAWVLSRFEDVRAVFKDPQAFSSKAMAEGPQSALVLPLLTDDPPRHTKLRALVNRAFTSRALKDMEAGVEDLAKRLVDRLGAGVPVDISEALTIPLPITVIAQLMAIPAERAGDFKRWSDAVTMTAGMSDETRAQEVMALVGYFHSLIPQRREQPGEDLVSSLVNAEIDGEVMSDEDIIGFCVLLLIAGNETTTNLLSNLLHYLASHPEQWTQLRERPELVDAAIEEILRFDAPVQYVDRKATRDVELHGQRVQAGDRVTLLMGSANRDERECPDADSFRLDRGRSVHHTFGYGIHFCIGAPLGRMEARYAMLALLDRFASLRQAGEENARTESWMLRGFHHLWLEFDTTS